MNEKKTVRMRKYQRSRARAVMEREGVLHMNRHGRGRGHDGKPSVSYFALNWKEASRCILKRKRG